MRGAIVADLAWPEVGERLAAGAIAVLPVGAAAKEHGPHLPMATDRIQADYLGRALAERSHVLVWPTVGYGFYPAFVEFPGSTTLEAETFEAAAAQIITGLFRHEAHGVLVLNTGISTIPPLERAVAHLSGPVRLANVYRGENYLATLEQVREQSHGSHADEAETSIMLAIAPDWVDLERAERWDVGDKRSGPFRRHDRDHPNYTPSGVWGDPTLATPDKGAQLLQAMLDDIDEMVDALRHGTG